MQKSKQRHIAAVWMRARHPLRGTPAPSEVTVQKVPLCHRGQTAPQERLDPRFDSQNIEQLQSAPADSPIVLEDAPCGTSMLASARHAISDVASRSAGDTDASRQASIRLGMPLRSSAQTRIRALIGVVVLMSALAACTDASLKKFSETINPGFYERVRAETLKEMSEIEPLITTELIQQCRDALAAPIKLLFTTIRAREFTIPRPSLIASCMLQRQRIGSWRKGPDKVIAYVADVVAPKNLSDAWRNRRYCVFELRDGVVAFAGEKEKFEEHTYYMCKYVDSTEPAL